MPGPLSSSGGATSFIPPANRKRSASSTWMVHSTALIFRSLRVSVVVGIVVSPSRGSQPASGRSTVPITRLYMDDERAPPGSTSPGEKFFFDRKGWGRGSHRGTVNRLHRPEIPSTDVLLTCQPAANSLWLRFAPSCGALFHHTQRRRPWPS